MSAPQSAKESRVKNVLYATDFSRAADVSRLAAQLSFLRNQGLHALHGVRFELVRPHWSAGAKFPDDMP